MATQNPSHVPPSVKTFNRIVGRIAGHRVYSLLLHMGRKSGKMYETPVMALSTARGLMVALTWGPRTDWYRNIMAASECAVQTSGRWYRCSEPTLLERDEAMTLLPPLTRTLVRLFTMRLFAARQFLLLRRVERTK
jgi:deazaflavin-dependent oxidoreductase (nitroreductase family)